MSRSSISKASQRGMVLVTSLLLLVVVTILGVAMFRSFSLDERIAGNVREKHRALNAAEAAEQYAEWWLSLGNGSNGVACAAPLVSYTVGEICTSASAPTNPQSLPVPWTVGVTYTPQAPTATNAAPTTLMPITGNAGGPNSYYFAPSFYITYLGASPNGLGSIYQIDAVGYAGSPDTAAVVETTYLIQQSVKDLGGQ